MMLEDAKSWSCNENLGNFPCAFQCVPLRLPAELMGTLPSNSLNSLDLE